MQTLDLDFFQGSHEITLRYWSSKWGNEWEPHKEELLQPINLVSDTGRASENFHPFIVLNDSEHSYAFAIPWSGNWNLRIARVPGSVQITLVSENPELIGISSHVQSGDWEEATKQLVREFRNMNYSSRIPKMKSEWNHWWPYEGSLINEEVFLRNARIAQECGIDVALLDSGWFGSGNWEDYRGNWDEINLERFPSGLSSLADKTRALGIEFGIWVEIESVGARSRVQIEHPDFMATRDGTTLETICLANPLAHQWAFDQLLHIITATNPIWIKFDFNRSPGLGCNHEDHGHTALNGHKKHIENFYRLLEQVRGRFPEITLENCSSGGLRNDYGVAQRVDYCFASDRDWPEHALSVFWAHSHFFPVETILGWCDSQWLGEQPNQEFSINSRGTEEHLEFIFAISLLGGFGISQRLEDFTLQQKNTLSKFLHIYKEAFRPRYQSNAEISYLSRQPERFEGGVRTVAFAIETYLHSPIIMIFQLSGASESTINYKVSDPDLVYDVHDLITGEHRKLLPSSGSLNLQIPITANTAHIYEISPDS